MPDHIHFAPRAFPFARTSVIGGPAEYAELRRSDPVVRVTLPTGSNGFVVLGYDDVRTVLADPRFSRAETIARDAPRLSALDFPAGSLFTLDPPHHTRLRKLVAERFSSVEVRKLGAYVELVTQGLLDDLARAGSPADLNEHLAHPLPITIICELLGVPLSDRGLFRRWADASVALTADPAQSLQRQQEMFMYFGQLLEAKRADAGEDLLSLLITAHDEAGTLTQYELMVLAMSILVAGFETTSSVIGTGIMTLLRMPEVVERLRADSTLIDPIVEELLRLNPIGDGGPARIALEDVVVSGVCIPKGSLVIASISSANLDESVFTMPDRLDLAREGSRHLAFGHGIHFCLGASLARLELRAALSGVFARFPTLRLDRPVESLRMTSGMLFHRLEHLPVRW